MGIFETPEYWSASADLGRRWPRFFLFRGAPGGKDFLKEEEIR
jgi:hypothetical protein